MTVAGGGEELVSFLIPAMRPPGVLKRCLASVEQAAEGRPHEIIVVATMPDPKLAEELTERPPDGLEAIVSKVNLGFANSLNLARQRASGSLLFVVQEDAVLAPGCLAALGAALDQHPGAGIAGPVIRSPSTPPDFCGMLVTRELDVIKVPAGQFGTGAMPVDYVSSSAYLARAEAWDQAGGPNGGLYPVGGVDLDLAMRMRASGRDVIAVPEAEACHDTGGEHARKGWRRFLLERNLAVIADVWAEQLLDHVEPGTSPATLERGLEIARGRSRELVPKTGAARPAGPTLAELEERLPGVERKLLSEYVKQADGDREALEAELRRLHELAAGCCDQLTELRDELEALRSELDERGDLIDRLDAANRRLGERVRSLEARDLPTLLRRLLKRRQT